MDEIQLKYFNKSQSKPCVTSLIFFVTRSCAEN